MATGRVAIANRAQSRKSGDRICRTLLVLATHAERWAARSRALESVPCISLYSAEPQLGITRMSRSNIIKITGALLVAGLLLWWHHSGGIIGRFHPKAASDPVEASKP